MKTIPAPLQAHLAGGVTTLCYCWRVTRHDGTVLGFTEHDRDIVAEGTTFSADTGFTASQIQQGSAFRSTTSTRQAPCPRPVSAMPTSWPAATTMPRSRCFG